jgi:hypothetical protein
MTRRIIINSTTIHTIKQFSSIIFKETYGFGNLDNSEIQAYLILKGLELYLLKHNIEPPFEVQFEEIKTKK